MWWVEMFRWLGMASVVVWGSFVVWRRMRPEYSEEEMLSLIVGVTVVAGLGGSLAAKWVGSFGVLVPAALTLWWYCRRLEWDFWEWADVAGRVSLWVGVVISLLVGRGWATVGLMVMGTVMVELISRTYRRFKWYKSGKMGLIFLVVCGMWASIEIGVETMNPLTIYWVGLTVAQWVAVVALIMVTAAIYLRSGQTLAEQLWRKTKNLR